MMTVPQMRVLAAIKRNAGEAFSWDIIRILRDRYMIDLTPQSLDWLLRCLKTKGMVRTRPVRVNGRRCVLYKVSLSAVSTHREVELLRMLVEDLHEAFE